MYSCEQGKGQREKERERISSRLHAVSAEPGAGLDPTNLQDHALSHNQELDT